MAGLLDFLSTPEGQGLLAGAFGGMAGARRGQPINSIGRAGMSGLLGYSGAEDRAQEVLNSGIKRNYMQAQIDENTSQIDERKVKMALAQRQQAALPGLFSQPMSQGAFAPSADGRGPVMPQSEAPQPGRFDVQGAIQAGFKPEDIAKYAGLQDLGRQEVARTVKGMGPNGVEQEYQVDKFGQRVGGGLDQYRAPISVNQGNGTTFVDPYNFKSVGQFKTFQSPDSAASNATTMRGQNMTDARARETSAAGGVPQFNAEAGGFVIKPSAANPNGSIIKLPGMPDKPLNESQVKNNLFGNRAFEADKILTALASDKNNPVDRPGLIKRTAEATAGLVPFVGDKLAQAAGNATNFTQSTNQQRVEQAQQDFINAVLRLESGAAIGSDEFVNANRQYFPVTGEDAPTSAQKAKNRQTAIQGMLAGVPARSSFAKSPAFSGGASSSFGSTDDPLNLFPKR